MTACAASRRRLNIRKEDKMKVFAIGLSLPAGLLPINAAHADKLDDIIASGTLRCGA